MEAAAATEGGKETPRPNRDRYAVMFGEDNPDVDFEDKEARYDRLAQERENYRGLKKSGTELSSVLSGNRWLAAMFMDLKDHPDKNPLVWFVENGIDVRAALDDPKVMEEVDAKFKEWQQKQVDGEANEAALKASMDESLKSLSNIQQKYGLTDEQIDRMWDHFWDDVFGPAFNGKVSEKTWEGMLHAMNYEGDIKNAREEAGMRARNEKHANKLKTYDEQQVPPSFGQSSGGNTTDKRERKESMMDFVKRYT